MDPRNTNFRIILALTTLPQDISLNNASLKVTLANTTKSIPLINKEATPLDFSSVQAGSKIEFGLEDAEGFMFGYSELKVPSTAFEKNETEVNEQLRFYLINKEKDSFIANVYAIFLNKGLFKEKSKDKSAIKSKLSPSKSMLSSRSPSASPSRKSPSKSRSEAKTNDKNFQAYLNRLVDSHSVQLRSLVDEHNSINEYIHLNKVHNNLPPNFADDSLETYSPIKYRHQSSTTRIVSETILDGPESAGHSFSLTKPAKQASDEVKLANANMLKDLSPMSNRKTSSNEETAQAAPGSKKDLGERSPGRSPLKFKATLERKYSEGNNVFNSPTKKKALAEFLTSYSGREAPDVAYYNAQINNLNNVIINQNSRLADFEIYKKENEELRVQAQRNEAARKTLQDSILETTSELKQENKDLEKQILTVLTEKELLIKKNNELLNTIHELSNALASTKVSLQEKEDINSHNALKLNELGDLKQQVKKLQDAVIASENQKSRDQALYKAALSRFEVSLQDTTKTIETMNIEKKRLVTELHHVQQELGLEKANHQATQNDLLLTKKKLENAENYKEVITSLEVQRDQLTQQLSDSRGDHSQTKQNLQESLEKLATRQREFEINEKTFIKDKTVLCEKLDSAESRNDRLNKEVNEQKLKVSQMGTNISSLEQLVCVKEDISKQLDGTQKQLGQVVEDRKALRAQLESVVVSQDHANNKLLEVERSANQLRNIIEEKEEEIGHLTTTVIALREAQDVYVPTKGDDIDYAVADFINTGHEVSKLKLLFVRETEGVYQFGSKRIYVKLESGRILIRVGGGFLTIDEFIDQYGALEMEKLARNDPLKKLSKNIAINKTLIGKCVNQIEKSKTMGYEYSTGAGVRMMNSSPSLQRLNSKSDY